MLRVREKDIKTKKMVILGIVKCCQLIVRFMLCVKPCIYNDTTSLLDIQRRHQRGECRHLSIPLSKEVRKIWAAFTKIRLPIPPLRLHSLYKYKMQSLQL